MERLTAYYGDCEEAYLSCERCGKTGIHECWTQEDCTQTAVDRLAAIEDILGDEYDLERLKELVQAKREGRCVVLPCGPGQVVWAANSFGVSSHQIRMLVRDKDGDFACSMIKFPLEDFGRKVFLTREEAEVALRREQDEQIKP